MSTLTDKLPKLTVAIDLDEAKKPLFAAVGAVEITLEQAKAQAKELPTSAKTLQAKVTETVTAKVEAARTSRTEQLKAARTTGTEQLKSVPAQLKALPTQFSEMFSEKVSDKVTAKATAFFGEFEARLAKAQDVATAQYGDLAARGEKLVAQVRKAETTTANVAEGKAAVKTATSKAATKKAAPKKVAKPAVVETPVVVETPATEQLG